MAVDARPGEPFDALLRRFTRGVEAGGILRDYRRTLRFKPAHEERPGASCDGRGPAVSDDLERQRWETLFRTLPADQIGAGL